MTVLPAILTELLILAGAFVCGFFAAAVGHRCLKDDSAAAGVWCFIFVLLSVCIARYV